MLIPNIYCVLISIVSIICSYLYVTLSGNNHILDTLYLYICFSFSIYCFLKIHSIHRINYFEGILVNMLCYGLFIIPFLFFNSINPLAPLWGATISFIIFSFLWFTSKSAKVGILSYSKSSRYFILGKIKAKHIKSTEDFKAINMLLYSSENLADPQQAELFVKATQYGIHTQNQKQVFEHFYGLQYDYSLTAHRTLRTFQTELYDLTKNIVFFILALLAIAVLGIVMGFVALLINHIDGKPIIYVQNRTGKYGKKFRIFKFRTMKIESNPDGEQELTRTGSFLRKTKLDELPQLFNIIRGEMSVIGPRPEWDKISLDKSKVPGAYHLRNLILPGITGWAQVNYRYTNSFKTRDRKLRSDLYYINNRNFIMDILILLRTIAVVFFNK